MASDLDALPDQEDQLCEVLAAYFEAVKAGHAPDRAAWLADHPEIADELAAFLEQQDCLLHITEPLRAIIKETVGVRRPEPIAGAVGPRARSGMQTNGAVHDTTGPMVHVFGDYELIGEPTYGGMSVVYRAVQRSLNRPVALKMLRGGTFADRDDVRRFQLEAEAIANLDHPNIVPIFEVGERDGLCYFAMKLIEGGSLAQQLGDARPSPKVAARLMATVARAVHHAHQRGILHRDLKPSNVMIDADVQPHVTDFGLAKRLGGPSDLTQSGAILGTPSYMAPEQATGRNKAITTATDVYGLGAILYALLTGKPPFKGMTVLETLEQVRQQPPERPGAPGRDVDRDLETICLKCLEKEPDRRYASALALAEDLESWLRGEPIAARPATRLGRAWRWCRRNPALAILAGATAALVVLLVTGAAIGGLFVWRERGLRERAFELEQVQRLRAEANAAEATEQGRRAVFQLSDSMSGTADVLFQLSSPKWSRVPEIGPLRVRLMETTLRHHEAAINSYAGNPGFESELAIAYEHLAAVYAAWSAYSRACELLARATAIREARLAEEATDVEQFARLAGVYLFMGYYEHLGNRDPAAREWCRKAFDVFDRILLMQPTLYRAYNTFAWSLATCPVPDLRNPRRAVELARRATAMLPGQGAGWNTLGAALLRAGEPAAALVALQHAMALNNGGDGFDWFLVAMAYHDLGRRADARQWFDKADRWTIDESYFHIELRIVHNEAAACLGLPRPSDDYLGQLRSEILHASASPGGK